MRIYDATDLPLGRLASHVAKELLTDEEEEITIINAEKTRVSGSRMRVLNDYKAKRVLNHPRKGPYFPKRPDRILRRTVRGMLPIKKSRGRAAYGRLQCFIGIPTELVGKDIDGLDSVKPITMDNITLGEVSVQLGSTTWEVNE